MDAFAYAADELRRDDRERFLADLFAPEAERRHLFALHAFNLEVARVREKVCDPLPGEVRLQWWRDLIGGKPHGDAAGNPLAAALIETISLSGLPRAALVNLIDARVFDLYDDPMESRTVLEGYAGETASALIQIASLVLDADKAADSADVAGHAGVAQAIAGLLLLMPQHRHRGQLYIPTEILSATGLDRDTFLAGKAGTQISAAIEAFAGLGLDHLAQARGGLGRIATSVFPAFLPVALAGPVLRKAKAAGARLFDTSLIEPQWRRQWRMALSGFTRRF